MGAAGCTSISEGASGLGHVASAPSICYQDELRITTQNLVHSAGLRPVTQSERICQQKHMLGHGGIAEKAVIRAYCGIGHGGITKNAVIHEYCEVV